MEKDIITITNALTGETIEREMTDQEQADRNAFLAEIRQQEEAAAVEALAAMAAKEAAQAKLAALGLTTDDLKALGL
jgi:mannose-1-phosphate guanylyltransferase